VSLSFKASASTTVLIVDDSFCLPSRIVRAFFCLKKILQLRSFVLRFYVFILKLVKASWTLIDERRKYDTIKIHHKASNNSPTTMDYSPPMPTTNTTSDTLTRLDVPRLLPIPPPSLSLLRTWSNHVVGTSLDVWSSLSLLCTCSEHVVGASLDVWSSLSLLRTCLDRIVGDSLDVW
jgi:hypothetical protein